AARLERRTARKGMSRRRRPGMVSPDRQVQEPDLLGADQIRREPRGCRRYFSGRLPRAVLAAVQLAAAGRAARLARHHRRAPVLPLEAEAQETIEHRTDDARRRGFRRRAGGAAGYRRRGRTRADYERRDRASVAALPGNDPFAVLRRSAPAVSR